MIFGLLRLIPLDVLLFVAGIIVVAVLLGVDVLAIGVDIIEGFLSPDWWPF